MAESPGSRATAVIDVSGLGFATEKNVVEARLGRRPGVVDIDANPVTQTATVVFDPDQVTIAELRGWVRDCGYHCAGQSVPGHICDPLAEPDGDMAHAQHEGQESPSDHEAGEHAGHGGHHHGGMSMASMVTDMRNRFLVAVVFALTITMYSHIGMDILGLHLPIPFGMRNDVWQLLLSLPVIFWSSWIFFVGAWAALRARTLDMMVLVAVGIGTGWLYSTVVTLTGGGDVFFEASTMLAAFVLLGHWFEMRARGGANDAIRTLLDLAPPMALVERDGQTLEVPTGEVVVGDLIVVRPGSKIPVDAVVEDGDSEVDESVVTGESLPVHKAPGDHLIGATINRNGVLRARATGVGSDTALAQIVKLVQEAQNSKAPGQRLADRAAFWLVLVALVGGALTFAAWMAFGDVGVDGALLYAITVVVITCPDALGLATPTAIMVGSGLGAKRGVLFKTASAIESSARLDVVVMDKTGTLTKGQPEVTDTVFADDIEPRPHAPARRRRRTELRAPHRPGLRHPRRSDRRRLEPAPSQRIREHPRPGRRRHRRRDPGRRRQQGPHGRPGHPARRARHHLDTPRHRRPHRHRHRSRRRRRCHHRRGRRPARHLRRRGAGPAGHGRPSRHAHRRQRSHRRSHRRTTGHRRGHR